MTSEGTDPYAGGLRDAANKGSSKSVSTVGHGTQISMVKVWAAAIDGRERWPSDAGELIVFTMDVATVGHFASESSDSVWSHRFLLNNRECATVPYPTHQLSMFCKLD